MFNLQFNYLSFLIKDLKCRIIGVDSFLSDKLVKTICSMFCASRIPNCFPICVLQKTI